MDIWKALTILGAVLTTASFGFGVWAFRQRYIAKPFFIVEDVVSLFHEIVQSVPNLSITYKRRKVSEGLVLIKGAFVNLGKKDITPSMAEEHIRLVLPEGSTWVESQISKCSADAAPDPTIIADRELQVDLGLLRSGESRRIEALARVPANLTPRAALQFVLRDVQFTHRIADTDSVRTEVYYDSVAPVRWLILALQLVVVMALALLPLKTLVLARAPVYERSIPVGPKERAALWRIKAPDCVVLRGIDSNFVEETT